MADATPCTPELADLIGELLQDVVGSGAAPPVQTFLAMAQRRDIAIVQRSRSTFLIDQSVYEGVCFRLQRERRIRPPHRIINADTWRGLKP